MRAIILEPPANRPWRASDTHDASAPARLMAADVQAVRRAWMEFGAALAAAFGRAGHPARRIETAPGDVTPELLAALDAEVVLVPHRQRSQFPEARPNLWFYMQTPLPRFFTVDPEGWGAAASHHPWRDDDPPEGLGGAFDKLARRLIDANTSKFAQPPRRSRLAQAFAGAAPFGRYIFFPCQIPHDENVVQFFGGAEPDLVGDLARWARARRIPVVFKAHPVNPSSMSPLKTAAAVGGRFVRWSGASVHDLIRGSSAVYTINSGVGLEAMLHGRPVVAFGGSDYDAAVIHGDPADLDGAWEAVRAWEPRVGRARYRRFLEDFTSRIAYDLDAGAALEARLDGLVARIASQTCSRRRSDL